MTHINSPTTGGEAHIPFGGTKGTGIGDREQGSTALDFYTELKVVYVDYTGRKARRQSLLAETTMKTIIKNGRIITAVDDYKADILIEDERVSVIGAKLEMEADNIIDASGKLCDPGRHRSTLPHMELPFGGTESSDDFRTGTIALPTVAATALLISPFSTKVSH
jgi:hypothetical protein